MNPFHDLSTIFPLSFIVLSGLIGAFSLGVICFAAHLGFSWAIDRWQEKHRRGMATRMSREEIMFRRLKASVKRRLSIPVRK
jgi:hypothetical protein